MGPLSRHALLHRWPAGPLLGRMHPNAEVYREELVFLARGQIQRLR